MAIKLSSLRADPRRENDGDWVELPEFTDPVSGECPKVLVRGWNYTNFQAAFSKTRGIWSQRGIRGIDAVPADIFQRDMARLVGEHILLNWQGFDEPYSREVAADILPASPKLLLAINNASQQLSDVQAEFVETSAGNSARSSAGNSAQTA